MPRQAHRRHPPTARGLVQGGSLVAPRGHPPPPPGGIPTAPPHHPWAQHPPRAGENGDTTTLSMSTCTAPYPSPQHRPTRRAQQHTSRPPDNQRSPQVLSHAGHHALHTTAPHELAHTNEHARRVSEARKQHERTRTTASTRTQAQRRTSRADTNSRQREARNEQAST